MNKKTLKKLPWLLLLIVEMVVLIRLFAEPTSKLIAGGGSYEVTRGGFCGGTHKVKCGLWCAYSGPAFLFIFYQIYIWLLFGLAQLILHLLLKEKKVDHNLVAYISSVKNSFPQGQVVTELLRAGWTQEQIIAAYKAVK